MYILYVCNILCIYIHNVYVYIICNIHCVCMHIIYSMYIVYVHNVYVYTYIYVFMYTDLHISPPFLVPQNKVPEPGCESVM